MTPVVPPRPAERGAEAAPAAVPASHVDRLAEIALGKGHLRDEDLVGLRELAAAAADRGIALRTLVAEYFASACRAWTDRPGIRKPGELVDPGDLASALIRAVGDATVALTEGYETAHRAAIRREEAIRREFVDDLLEGRTDLGRLAERAELFGLRLMGPHRVAVARGAGSFGAGDAVSRCVEEGMALRFGVHDVLITTKDGQLVCVSRGAGEEAAQWFAAQLRNAGSKQFQMVISRPRPGPSGIVRSYREARSTLDLIARLGLSAPVVDATDLLVFQVLGRDRAAITDLVATVLGGLEQARGGPQPLLETLTTYYACGCVNTTTARRLGLSVRTISYRLARIRQLTGYDPTDPDERYALQTATLGARLLGWPSGPLQPAD